MAEGNCDEVLHELYGFLDGELTTEKRGQIQQHIDDCTPCIEAYEFENDLRQVISQKCRDTVPEDLRQRIADAIGKAEEPSS
jgi:mycothiol system anti-sigma-R factor